jgi:hypothetical protein
MTGRIALLVSSVLFSLVVLELGMRLTRGLEWLLRWPNLVLAHQYGTANDRSQHSVHDDALRFVPRPGARVRNFGRDSPGLRIANASHDEHGMRMAPSVLIPALMGSTILAAGDSFTRLREQHARLSPNSQVAKAIAYSLNVWDALAGFLDDGHLCMTNNAAERALRCIAVEPNNWTFAGSEAGGRRAAAIYTLIEAAKLNDTDPQAWLTDETLLRLQDEIARQTEVSRNRSSARR